MSETEAVSSIENIEPVVVAPLVPIINPIIELAEHEDLEGDLKEIYDLVYAKVKLIVSTGKFTAEHLRPIS